MYKLDRTAFYMGKAKEESVRQAFYWHDKTPQERLKVLYYLLCEVYGFEDGRIPSMDRAKFSMRKHT
ncbi:MAG: hypothetical protein AAGG68_19635 [Bacteroidota bacterium]